MKYQTSNFNGAEDNLERHLNHYAERGCRLVSTIVTPNKDGEPYKFLFIWEAL